MSYSLLMLLLWPVVFLYTLKIAWRAHSLRYLQQRLGYSYTRHATKPVWIHCASVGEVNTFIPLLKLLVKQCPNTFFLITTTTPTGAQLVEKHNIQNTQHSYLPIDSYTAVNRFLKAAQPKIAIIMETEIWPHLFKLIHKKDIPLCIINGRLSEKTLNVNNWIRKQYKQALSKVDYIFSRSDKDKDAYIFLGADPGKISTLGNLKFAQTISSDRPLIKSFTDRPYVLAASTHNNEEFQLAEAWKSINSSNNLLVIVPRHPERAASIIQQLEPLKLNIACRSHHQAITENTDIYIADTIGELPAFIDQALIVFMGGSLVPHGGQNLLEPASMAKPIIVGPHMFNFAAEVDLFLSKQACIKVENIEQFKNELSKLLTDEIYRASLGQQAQAIIDAESSIAENYLIELKKRYVDVFAS